MLKIPSISLIPFVTMALGQQMKLAQNYTGSTFFDRWTFYNGIDVNTTGNVLYQTREQAQQLNLTMVNSAGNVIIKVDNTTSGVNDPTFGRPSVKILSNDTLTAGSLMIMDAVHLPFGCSVWPAYWTQGSNWPDDGEIDIVENVNMAPTNQYALHTLQGCMHPPAGQVQETGKLIAPDCFNQTNGNEGCLVQDNSTQSYGAGFAAAGGGVYATLWDNEGIRIWFFPRSQIPSDVASASPNPSSWPTPTAFYPQSSCDTTKFFGPQTIIFDITICGNFAGNPAVFQETCQGNCLDLVQTPSNYNDAFFEIKYLAVFSNSTSSTGTSSSQSSAPSSSGSPGSSNNTGSAKTLRSPVAVWTLIAALCAPLLFFTSNMLY